MARSKKVKTDKIFKIRIVNGDKEFVGFGDTVFEAITDTKFKGGTKAVTSFFITKDNKERLVPVKLGPLKMSHIINKPLELAVFAKRITMLT